MLDGQVDYNSICRISSKLVTSFKRSEGTRQGEKWAKNSKSIVKHCKEAHWQSEKR